MASNKRERELARAKYERQSARRAQRASRAKRRQTIVAAVVVVALVLASVAWAVWAVVGRSDTTADQAPLESLLPTASASASPSPLPTSSAMDCTPPGTPRADNLTYGSAPTEDASAVASITLTTNCGDIVIALDHDAPKTVASEVFLAKNGFYDGTVCHRLTTQGIFVLQCGDPKGDGTGGPGYTVPDENLPSGDAATYPAGTVAMANAGAGTSGSQFFIVYEDTVLPGDYTVWGTVTEGLGIVKEVAKQGTTDKGADGQPQQTVFIESASIKSA